MGTSPHRICMRCYSCRHPIHLNNSARKSASVRWKVAHHLEAVERVRPSTRLLPFASQGADLQVKTMTQTRIKAFGICVVQETTRTSGVFLNIRRNHHRDEQESILWECKSFAALNIKEEIQKYACLLYTNIAQLSSVHLY